MKEVTLITVGKLKEKSLLEFELNYLKRINQIKFNIIELKALQEDKVSEGKLVLKKFQDLGSDRLILLSERGKQRNSVQFSKWFFHLIEKFNKITFVISGAAGHSDELLEKSHEQLSLSELTYPHQMARVIFVEQVYRAQTIHTQHPYHK